MWGEKQKKNKINQFENTCDVCVCVAFFSFYGFAGGGGNNESALVGFVCCHLTATTTTTTTIMA